MIQYDRHGAGAGRLTRRTLLRALAFTGLGVCGIWSSGCGQDGPVIEMNAQSQYRPARLTIKAGDTVIWRNTSSIDHTVTGDPAKVVQPSNVRLPPGAPTWDSGRIAAGQTWSHTFTVSGDYRYCCVPHELAGMVGTLTVEP